MERVVCPCLAVDLFDMVSCLIWSQVVEPNPQYGREKELNCVFLQVVKNLLDLKDEQLAVQMDAQDTLWGETGTLFLCQINLASSPLSVYGCPGVRINVDLNPTRAAQQINEPLMADLSDTSIDNQQLISLGRVFWFRCK